MKKLLLIFILLSTMLSAEIIDRIIAKVGNNIILESELDEQIQQIKAFNNTELELSNFDILNKIIETELIIQKAKKEGYEINEISIKAMAEQQIQSIASQFSSEYEFKTELKKAGFTVSKLKEHYTKQIKQQQLQERIINAEIKNKIVTTEAEILEYYNENKENYLRPEMVKLGLIMRSINASTETQKTILEEMTRIRNEVINGADFQKLAKENSDCPSAEKGGNLGFFGKGRMVKPFEAAAFKLNIGEISEIVKTDFGYHIIKLNAKNDDEIDVSHILKKIELTQNDIDIEINLMTEIEAKLSNGADFSELSIKYSEEDSVAINGGIIGEFTENQLPELFQKDLIKIKIGEHTKIIREDNTFYIFKKMEKVESRAFEYVEIFEELKKEVQKNKEMKLYENWINTLKQEIYVEILIDK
ncbi:MAG: hypothetical protein HN952_01550 [Candidatus Cloacimonetes bacterium]|jgi:peptidyl-prolyl cis-trans isomerase SurA|nr:hypothetical protein [Candidatus Cloacimonadota bacterium]MBT6993619.1 hypothetical protein [Candidatus Cloacimonadota bacterium]